ncbi:tetratricopeptide repeat protein [Gorillibacterium sp. CAU 1737]|uniref:J domain-containing protein n=1 Tax=Gorillibacterium sp. CAU 1737 TaxID=3140362 RepID=UPI0032616405
MSIWTILGLDPTEDTSLIRRAYASKLKIHHPEDDPESYQRLREAFDEAMRLAKSGFLSEEDDSDFDERDYEKEAYEDEDYEEEAEDREVDADTSDPDDAAPETDWLDSLFVSNKDERQSSPPEIVVPPQSAQVAKEQTEAFLKKVQDLYADPASRFSMDKWVHILNDEAVWRIDDTQSLTERLLTFFNEHYFLPDEVWAMLDNAFGFKELMESDLEAYIERFPKVWEYSVLGSAASRLGYSTLPSLEGGDLEAYLHQREKFVTALIEQNLEAAYKALTKVLPVQESNPILLWLMMQFYRDNGDREKALRMCSEAIQLNPGDRDLPLLRASLLIDLNRAQEALDRLKPLEASSANNLQFLSLLGKSYLQLEQLEAARDVYVRMLALQPGDADALVGLAKADAFLLKKRGSDKPNRKRVQQIHKEWGKQPFLPTLRNAFRFLFRRKFLISLIILLHVLMSITLHKSVEMSFSEYIHYIYAKPEIPLVETTEELKAIAPGSAVRLHVTKGAYTGIIELEEKGTDGKKRSVFAMQEEAKEAGTYDDLEGFLSRAVFEDTPLILLTNYKQSRTIYEKKGTLEIKAVVQDPYSAKWSEFRTYLNSNSRFPGGLAETTVFLNMRDKINSGLMEVDFPISVGIYAASLMLLYLILLKAYIMNWSYIRYR